MNFQLDTNSVIVQGACIDMLQKVSKNRRHHLKKNLFDNVPANEVSVNSPVPYVTDPQWKTLVAMWSSPRHKVCIYMRL